MTRTGKSILFSFFTCILLLYSGCSLDYSELAMEESMAASIPDTILYSFTHTVIRDGKPVFIIQAGEAQSFRKKNQTEMSNVRFFEYDVDGTVLTEGKADHALFYNDTENADISGNIRVYSSSEKGEVTGETLYWKSKEKLLTSGKDEDVQLKKESGSSVRGKGFEADFKRRTLSFETDVYGVYETEDNEKTTP